MNKTKWHWQGLGVKWTLIYKWGSDWVIAWLFYGTWFLLSTCLLVASSKSTLGPFGGAVWAEANGLECWWDLKQRLGHFPGPSEGALMSMERALESLLLSPFFPSFPFLCPPCGLSSPDIQGTWGEHSGPRDGWYGWGHHAGVFPPSPLCVCVCV